MPVRYSPIADRRRRLVFLVGHLGYGGSERQLYLLLSQFDPAVWDASVLVFNPSPNDDYAGPLEHMGVRVEQVPPSVRGAIARGAWVLRTMLASRPHVVHSWTVHDNPYAGLIGRLAQVPVRWGSLRSSTTLAGFSDLPAAMRWLSLRSVQRLVVNSRAVAQELSRLGLGPERVVVLPNCVGDPGGLEAADLSSLGIAPEHRVIGCVGNIRRAKNQLMFVRAVAAVVRERPDVRGLLVGEVLPEAGDLARQLRGEVVQLGLEGRVILAGFRGDVPRVMKRLSVLCMPSDSEGMPNVVLEAMAAGVPVVATRVGGVPEVVEDGVTGLLVDPGDVDGCARSIARLLDEPGTAGRVAARARIVVRERHDCAAMARRLEGLYLEALETRSRRVGFSPPLGS